MNEAKPIVTYHGNSSLFGSLHQIVSQGLPKEPCEWRRSYGRAPRNVHLGASFVPYDADILPDDDEKTLVSRPYFHLFWTDCDLESYKQTVKDEIGEWLSALKAKNIPDWLIIVVTSDESKMKAKLLPRSSVIDKVKNDFCNKFNERCILLTDPLKLDSKSSESLSQMFERLRSLLLQAYSRILTKYEDSMRTRREKRNEPGWNYFTYFIFQEELAFMLEMLGLKEDALIQYDELDAMFDQFIENHANGKMVKWLTPLLEPCTCWAGLSLVKSLDLDLRDEVKQSNASLLDFRNYLFSRQAALLFQMKRAWEAANRAMTFVYQTMSEMKALEIEIPKGAMACWVFLSCLEVLRVCNKEVTGKMDEKFALHTASLWDFAHKKLQELGNLCSLMPGLMPSSEQLSLVVDLVSGMGTHEESLVWEPRPVDKLRESLSSPESFKKHYLEMCEQAMGTYKYIGRYRSSRMLGKEIADFYMKIGEPEKAENFLLDAIRMYQKEGWHHLADGTITELAKCQKLLGVPSKYVKTTCHIACSLHLPSTDKEKYFEETEKTLQEVSENLEMRASQAIFIDQISLDQTSLCVDEGLNLTLDLTSNFPKPVTFTAIQMSIVSCSESTKKLLQQQQLSLVATQPQKVGVHQRKPSLHYVPFNNMANFQPSKKELPAVIQCRTSVERQKGRIASCGIVCDRAHDLLKRTDSAQSDNNANIQKGDYSLCFSNSDVTLQPGTNTLSFSLKIAQRGVYKLDQLCCSWKSLHLLKPLDARDLIFEVISLSPQVVLKPTNANEFITGVEQEASLTFTSGSCSIAEGSPLNIVSSPTFNLCKIDGSKELTLPHIAPLKSCDIPVLVKMNLESDAPQPKFKKAKMKVSVFNQIIEHEVEFLHPFTVTHKVYTMEKHKFIQVTIVGNTRSRFVLSNASLQAIECPDVDLVLKNNSNLSYPVSKQQSVSFLWQLNCNIPVLPVLELTFSCTFSSPQDDNKQSQDFTCSFAIHDFQTQYILSYDVSSMEENKSCITGESAVLDIRMKQLEGALLTDGSRLAYTVKANGSIWAIGGKSSGVFTMKEGKHHIILDVVPMQPGFLHFPLVTLYKYSDHLEEIAKIDDDGDGSEDDSAPLKPPPKTWSKERTDSQVSLSSMSSGQLSTRLIEFSPGQVYNESRSRQIRVYPCKTTPDIDVSLVR